MKQRIAASFIALNVCVPASAELRIEPYTLRTFDGRERAVEIGRLALLESRSRPAGARIEVAFLRLKTSAAAPGSPIVFLMGGPGIPASLIGQIPPYWSLFDRLRERADVILLDQRGLGLSTPRLDCPPSPAPPPPDLFESHPKLLGAFRARLEQCVTHWRAHGVDPTAYTVEAIADDVDDLRRAVGSERVSLLAFSYGTRLALEFVRRHPERVDRVVLAGTLGVDDTLKLPSAFDETLADAAALAAADASFGPLLPDMAGDVRRVSAAAQKQPLSVAVKTKAGEPLTLRVGADSLRSLIAGRLGDRRLPALVATSKQGDHAVLARMLESIYNDLVEGGGSLMARAVVCSAPSSPDRSKQAAREAPSSSLGLPFDNLMQSAELCSALGAAAGQPSWQPVRSERPALFVTGTLDDRTPVANAERTAMGFPNSVQVVVENGGHELLPSEAVRAVVVDFLGGRAVASARLTLPKPTFASIEEAKAPPRPPGR